MKRIIDNIGAMVVAGILCLLSACSTIDDGERLLYVEPATVGRAVLIEDFTGQRCVNCPYAADMIEELQEQYGADNVIAVGLHTEPLGFAGNASTEGLMNDESRAYGQYWGVESQPIGMVNRRGGLKDRNDWGTAVYNEIQQSAPVIITLSADYDEADSKANVEVCVSALRDFDGKLQLWLVQDSITALQIIPSTGKADRNYVHNHVFRGCLNGLWGDDISIVNGQTHEASYAYSLDNEALPAFAPQYVPAHCSVVAFVYNDGGVQQAVKTKICVK